MVGEQTTFPENVFDKLKVQLMDAHVAVIPSEGKDGPRDPCDKKTGSIPEMNF